MADIDSGLPVRSYQDADERVQVKVVDATTVAQQMEVDADGDAHVKAKLRDDAGNAFGTEANPLYVVGTDDPSDEVHDFNAASAINEDASADHTFSPSVDTLVHSVLCSASGLAKFEIKFGATASEVLKYVVFNSTAKPNVEVQLPNPISLAGTTDSLVITKTNLDKKAQDLYSSINGKE